MIDLHLKKRGKIHNQTNFPQLKQAYEPCHPQTDTDARAYRWIDTSITLPSDAVGQLNILWHNCYALGRDGTEIGILHEAYWVGLTGLLKCQECKPLHAPSIPFPA